MSDYEFCPIHKLSYLIPEYIVCPDCWLEMLMNHENKNTALMAGAILDDMRTMRERLAKYEDQERKRGKRGIKAT